MDPLTASFPYWTPYAFAGNSPIDAIDLDGLEKIVVHLLDKTTRTKLSSTTQREIQKSFSNRMKMLNVNLTLEFIESKQPFSKNEFYNREGGHWSDSYVLIGDASSLENIDTENLGWGEVNWQSDDHVGYSSERDGISKIGIDNAVTKYESYKATAEYQNTPERELFQSYTFGETMSLFIEHESLHPKLRFHPNNTNEIGHRTNGLTGHIGGTIMGESAILDMKKQIYEKVFI